MAKRFQKWVLYILYMIAGGIISYFLPDALRYPFGFLLALTVRWAWAVLNDREVHHG